MGNVFTKAMLPERYQLIDAVLTKGAVCPFLSQLHSEPVTHGILHPCLCSHDKT